jgi:hypothetical protein
MEVELIGSDQSDGGPSKRVLHMAALEYLQLIGEASKENHLD